jgi:hypothetical protein
VGSAHLVSDRTDPANPCGNVRRLGKTPSTQECFEKARRLKDFQFHVHHIALLDLDPHRALAFDTREVID